MKYLAIVVLAVMFTCAWARTDHVYSWDDHKDSKTLYTALKDEPDLIFILFWYNKDDSNEDLKKANDKLKADLQKDVLEKHKNDGIQYSEIDLKAEGKADAYKTILEDIMQIKVDKLDKGPIISVVHDGEGAWITGPATAKEVEESVDIFIHEDEDKRVGQPNPIYGSDKARTSTGGYRINRRR
uniref:Uncharacterized protein n=1 Tax=Euplotes crassus TaxID=5936 RepID=A0A7S3KFB8_EUPCR|mmetsp:Transcript_20152/g.19789  ORF Transcript_20152/g.19789 Transcript_20152/m.19789 type:complete len:184 (+) Transcript_20152:10-561(+)|eukprot:CAMPEP_0197008010 /NCGR_PEP_ID=MMETSP1380-20130617/43291_1 /TAXON_ID=5936 /ORGANISM="Euplotes crassus, Strain CT5" /LENGTH=183 /DNA_ID=CAMNT_0042428371 /DNA_START=10 /DNA_END=561 /DNA_ORIENTATION=+